MNEPKTQSAVVSSELVSCPFCGSTKIMCEGSDAMAWMCCQKCLAQGPAVSIHRGINTSKSARVRWNERAANKKAETSATCDVQQPKTYES